MNEIIKKYLVSIFSEPLALLVLLLIFVFFTYLAIEKVKKLRKFIIGIVILILMYYLISIIPINESNILIVIGAVILAAIIITILVNYIYKQIKNKNQNKNKNKKIIEEKKSKNVNMYYEDIKKDNINDKMCPECGGELVLKEGKFGKFYGCSSYPDCTYIKKITKAELNVLEKNKNIQVGIKDKQKDKDVCPKCGSLLIKKEGKYGEFFGCSNYPQCKYIKK